MNGSLKRAALITFGVMLVAIRLLRVYEDQMLDGLAELTGIWILPHLFVLGLFGLGVLFILYAVGRVKALRWGFIAALIILVVWAVLVGDRRPPWTWSGVITDLLIKPVAFLYPLLVAYPAVSVAGWLGKDKRGRVTVATAILCLIFMAALSLAYIYIPFIEALESGAALDSTGVRDKVYESMGWTKCGEYRIEGAGKHAFNWEKQLKGNESFACYWTINLPKPMWVKTCDYKFTVEIFEPYIPYYHSVSLIKTSDGLPEKPFMYFYREEEVAVTHEPGARASAAFTERIDVFFSFRPAFEFAESREWGGGVAGWVLEVEVVPVPLLS